MPETYDDGWVAAAAELWPYLPPIAGSNATVSLAIATAPRRQVAFHWRYEDGVPAAGGSGDGGQPDLSLTVAAADAPDLLAGRVEPSVAFMRGRLKSAGDQALLLAFLASTATEQFEEWRRRAGSISAHG